MENYYELFGIDKNASKEVLDAVYKTMIKTASEQKKMELEYAYSILSDPTKRAEYNEKLKYAQKVPLNNNSEQNKVQAKKSNSGCLKFILIVIIGVIIFTFKNCTNKTIDTNNQGSDTSVSEEGKKPLITKDYNMIAGTDFSDGVAFIECKNGDMFAIDPTGKKLFEVKDNDLISIYGGYKNGVLSFKNSLYDKQFNAIATPESKGYDKIEYSSNGNIIVSKYVESYVGDERKYGVLDNKGNWTVELSSEGSWTGETYTYTWSGGYIESEETSPKTYRFKDCYLGEDDEGLKLVDYNNKVLIDLSQYNDPRHFSYYEGYLLFEAYNENDVKYAFLLNKDGSFAIEPIRLHDTAIVGELDSHGFYIQNDIDLVMGKGFDPGPCFFVEYDGNIIEYDDNIEYISGFPNGLESVYVYDKYFVNSVKDFYYINYKGEKVIE